MPESPVEIAVNEVVLEGRYEERGGAEGAVICHPHPLYGGDMDNNVVLAMRNGLGAWGASTLRFNFRGTGSSGGQYGAGEGETQDVIAAVDFLARQGKSTIHLAGYSFGAWVGLKAIGCDLGPTSCILVSPPIDFLDFSELRLPDAPCLITLGNEDTFCSVSSLKNWIARNPNLASGLDLELLPGIDHFYAGSEGLLSAKVEQFLERFFRTHTV